MRAFVTSLKRQLPADVAAGAEMDQKTAASLFAAGKPA
jgi:hypothetical protein